MTIASYLDLDNEAMRLWQQNHGTESLDQQCERWTGYYEQWAGQGNEKINGYASARAAYGASAIYTRDLSQVQLGDILFFDAAPYDHVTRVVGFDGGRPIHGMASKLGDTLLQFPAAVKYSHADTYPHPFKGAAKSHDHNPVIQLAAWSPAPASAPASTGGGVTWGPNDRLRLVNSGKGYQYWEPVGPLAADIMAHLVARGRIDVKNFVADGNPGPATRRGIQRTLSVSGVFKGQIDGVIALGGSRGIQTYGSRAKNHPYRGKVDGVPQQNSWVGFANFLREP